MIEDVETVKHIGDLDPLATTTPVSAGKKKQTKAHYLEAAPILVLASGQLGLAHALLCARAVLCC